MSNNKFLTNESTSTTATKISAWDNTGVVGEKIPANVPTNPDGSAQVQALTDAQLRASNVGVAVNSTVLATDAATATAQATGNASVASIDSKLTNLSGVTTKTLSTQVVPADTGLVVNAVIHGLTTGGGGGYVDVKVNPSGSLVADVSGSSVTSNIGTTGGLALDSSLTTLNAKDFATQTTLALIKAKTDNIDVALSTRTKPTDAQNIRALTSTDQVTFANTSIIANAGTNLNTSLLALDSTVAKDASLATLNTSVNTLLKPASTLAAVTSITNTVTVKADTPANQTNAFKVDGSATTQPISNALETASTGTITSPANAITSFSVLATNANRKGFIIHNDSTTTVFVAFAATASATAFTIRLTSQASYISNSLPIYRGVISAIALAANGNLRVTELT